MYDLFISYPRADVALVRPLVEELGRLGLSAWVDEREIGDADAITRSIVEGLGQARMLVAWYSRAYTRSRPCQWELTAAYLAAQHEGGDLSRRILVINPEPGADHIQPVELRDRLYLEGGAGTADAAADLARRIAKRLDRAATTWIGDIRPLQAPSWLAGQRRIGSNRFVGRVPDLWSVHSGLTAAAVTVVTGAGAGGDLVQVQGMGGIGKSMLAEEYALRFGAAYPAGIVWLSAARTGAVVPDGCETEAEGGRHLFDLARRFGLPVQGMEPAAVAAQVSRHLEALGKPYLWIVDDLPSDANADLLAHWTAPSTNGRTLVTTRGTRLDGCGKIHRLDVLPQEDAVRLLTSRQPPRDEAERRMAAEIVTELGRHALAVDVAGAALRVISYADFLKDLRTPSADALALAAELAGELPNGHHPGIAVTLRQSIGRLRPEGVLVLQLASLLAPDPIPTRYIVDVLAEHAGDETAGRRAALLGTQAAEAEALLDRLGPEEVMVHILTARTMRRHAAAPEALRAAAVRVMNRVMRDAADIRKHAALEPLIEHVRLLTESVEDAETAALLTSLDRYESEREVYSLAGTIWRRELEASQSLHGDEHPNTLTSMNNLAATLWNQGDLAGARELQEEVLAVRRRVFGGEHPDTLTAMNNLASTLWSQGDLAGARELQEQVLTVRRRALGEERPDTLTSMNNLAETLRSQGDLAGARELQEEVLAVSRRVLGDEHPNTLTSMNNLASTLWSQGDLAGARVLEKQVLAVRRRVLGEEHPEALTSMNNLARTLLKQGDSSGARVLFEQALPIAQRKLGNDHPITRALRNGLDFVTSLPR
ncbi:tetratricopeptide (TPR) repeat protein [Azospirillum lipoferum]|uniref:Tetratricopeptide repeat protein n=1 Tax=Azospirillum lipoferum TaxID=193 RepID=A0A5A9FUE6_AZOLI|nr:MULTISPECIES: toll/interleukin-1 receptor domain-containing protein [Azospirillum]KAA0585923.1 tetratricopeptide repeat protein [Azospirillum lipoferum]MCP1615138.1 tetratricopeptide (TPR) repeat protein [Azospirillum lipoferum]MDW5533035.1 tetratricopeptide repeat protein [Azospirillum sp. NL1]